MAVFRCAFHDSREPGLKNVSRSHAPEEEGDLLPTFPALPERVLEPALDYHL